MNGSEDANGHHWKSIGSLLLDTAGAGVLVAQTEGEPSRTEPRANNGKRTDRHRERVASRRYLRPGGPGVIPWMILGALRSYRRGARGHTLDPERKFNKSLFCGQLCEVEFLKIRDHLKGLV